MIHVCCHTNLDLSREEWPTSMPAVPQVGDLIQSKVKHKKDFQLELEVRSITWKYDNLRYEWYPHIELHMSKFHGMLMPRTNKDAAQGSIIAFYDWYAPLVGRSPGAFI